MQSKIGQGYRDIFHNSQAAMLIIDTDAPAYTMLDVNNAYLEVTNTKREDLIGKSVFGVFPGNPTDNVSKNIERTIFSFEQAIQNKKPHVMSDYRYDIPIPGTNEFEERYWTTSNSPVMNEAGEVIYFIHSPANVTELHRITEKEKAGVEAIRRQQEQLYSTFMQAPVGIGIFKGKDNVVDLVNPSLCELYGKTQEELMGKPIFDVLTHVDRPAFEPLLENVRLTGESFIGDGLELMLQRNGAVEKVFVNFVYEPFREAGGNISGVIAVATEVTAQVNAKKKLAEAEERLRLATDAVGLGTFDLDLLSGEMVTSISLAHIFGLDKPVSRKQYVTMYHPEDAAVREQAHRDAISSGKLFYETRITTTGGTLRWVRVEGKVFYDDNGKAFRILGTLLDITAQRQYVEEQRKLISLVDNSVDLMSILNMEGYNTYINEAGRKLLGFNTEEEVRTIPISELHAPEHYELVQTEVLPSVMGKGSWSGEMLVRHLHTQEIFPVYNNCFRIDDPVSGQPIAVGAVMRDLRPEYAAKQALADSERVLRNITSAAPTALWMSDETGAITYVNQTWMDWSGSSYEQSLGEAWLEAVVPEDRQRTADKFINDLTARNFYEAEFRIEYPKGNLRYCFANGRPQYRGDGSFAGYIGACVDITEQKQVQQQKDDFIGIASHELKTPVTSIKGYAQVLEKILLKKGDTKEAAMMTRMNDQVNRLTSLISDLLDVTKINSGRLQSNDTSFDFNGMVKELLEDLQRASEKHELVGDYNETGIIYGDRERIGQVISNLITNAIKYSPQADKIIIHTAMKDGEVTLCVEDFGIGIPSDKLGKVFEQFYRVSGDMQHTFPGLGLGLYISSEIIKRENGRIWVNSTVGKGSTFCFSLPLRKAPGAAV